MVLDIGCLSRYSSNPTCVLCICTSEPVNKFQVPVPVSRSANVTCLSLLVAVAVTAAAAAVESPLRLSVDVFSAGLVGGGRVGGGRGGGVKLYPSINSICSAATRFAIFLFGPTPVHTLSPTVTWIEISTVQ